MITPKAMLFLLLHLLLCLQRTQGNTDALQVALGKKKGGTDIEEVSEDLRWAETEALQHSNNWLGKKEFSRGMIYSVPFDKEHFMFNSEDWTVYDLPNSTNEQMIVSATSADVTKELKIGTSVRAPSNLRIRYQIHLTDDIPVKPSFSVFLISNGNSALLKEENPKELWSNSSLNIKTEAESQLLFVGILKDPRNRMALRGFTVQDLSVSTLKRYGDPFSPGFASEHLLMGSEEQQEASVSTSKSSSRVESNFSEVKNEAEVNVSPRRSQVRIDSLTKIGNETTESSDGSRPLLNVPNDMTLLSENPDVLGINPDYEDRSSDEEGVYGGMQSEKAPGFQDDDFSAETPSINITFSTDGSFNSSTSSTNTPEEENLPSVAKEVFIFFVVFMVISAIILAFIWWRRRRKRAEDEIPVFSRASTEHGNPAFVNDQTNYEIGMNSERPSNYKSFQ